MSAAIRSYGLKRSKRLRSREAVGQEFKRAWFGTPTNQVTWRRPSNSSHNIPQHSCVTNRSRAHALGLEVFLALAVSMVQMLAAPFPTFTFSALGVSAYQLGNFGTAAKQRHSFKLTQ